MHALNVFKSSILASTLLAAALQAGMIYDGEVTPDVIFGSGNANGAFTISQQNGVEVALRAKVRYNASNSPENTFNNLGSGVYQFDIPSWVLPSNKSVFNFEWSVNTDFAGATNKKLSDYSYLMGIDFDPSSTGTNYVLLNPLSKLDNALGTNSTGNGGGNSGLMANLFSKNRYNVAQNSWNLGFFDDASHSFDPYAPGVYDIFLQVFEDGEMIVAESRIQIVVGPVSAVPEPSTALFLLTALTGTLLLVRRR